MMSLMSGHSNSDQPHAKSADFKPSKEVEDKMQPVGRDTFFSLLRGASNSPVPKSSQKSK
jgi:hypothetical protein